MSEKRGGSVELGRPASANVTRSWNDFDSRFIIALTSMLRTDEMLKFRDLPTPNDSRSGLKPPSSWPNCPKGGFTGAIQLAGLVRNDWDPWWAKVDSTYSTSLTNRQIGIRGIAFALFLEHTNGWTFDFCLRFCEENLMDTAQGISLDPKVALLTKRGRAMVDEIFAGAAAAALAALDGYCLLGDLGRYMNNHPDMVKRRWPGNGPDYIVAKIGKPADGFVAEFMLLESKGVASLIPNSKPRDFDKNKAQSLNAEMQFICNCRPILSYLYLPITPVPTPMVAQWFNVVEQQKDRDLFESAPQQARLLLQIALDQFRRIIAKLRLPLENLLSKVNIRRQALEWRRPMEVDGQFLFISRDWRAAIAISPLATDLFFRVSKLLDNLRGMNPANFPPEVSAKLKHQVRQLQKLAPHEQFPLDEVWVVSRRKFAVIARDVTGFTFMHHVGR